ncbi:MAG TPA: hypothetical protein VG225_12750 [Terracidiphilus sp.]|jgi:hypothetical protein|nr:hypothetical protein [Terracidiphilus sp.]
MQTIKLQRPAMALTFLLAAGCVLSIPNPAAFAQTAVTGALCGLFPTQPGP